MRNGVLLLFVCVLFVPACQRDPAPMNHKPEENKATKQALKILKIKVSVNGEITVDEKPMTLEQIADRLTELKENDGEVWYHRENPTAEPHPNALKVIQLVTRNELPIRLSAKPDFSDVVDEKGVSHPQGK
jgi:biopolymer transport protein ExbD